VTGRLVPAAVAAMMLPVLLSGCVTSARDDGAYLQNGKAALELAISETATGVLAVESRLKGDATRAYADTVITDSETGLSPIEASFGSVDPPTPQAESLRDEVLQALGDADNALASARIAIRRNDPAALSKAGQDLAKARTGLDDLREKLG